MHNSQLSINYFVSILYYFVFFFYQKAYKEECPFSEHSSKIRLRNT